MLKEKEITLLLYHNPPKNICTFRSQTKITQFLANVIEKESDIYHCMTLHVLTFKKVVYSQLATRKYKFY